MTLAQSLHKSAPDGEFNQEQAASVRGDLDLPSLVQAYVLDRLKLKDVENGLDYSKITLNIGKIAFNLNMVLADILRIYHGHDPELSVRIDGLILVEATIGQLEKEVVIHRPRKWWQTSRPEPQTQIEIEPDTQSLLSCWVTATDKKTIKIVCHAVNSQLGEAVRILDAFKAAIESFLTSHKQDYQVSVEIHQL